jgi:hypothetical protein
MKLLNSNEPLGKEIPEAEADPEPPADEPFGLTTKHVIHRPRPLPASTVNLEPADEAGFEPASPPPAERRTRSALRTSGQGVPSRSRLFRNMPSPGARLRAAVEAGKHAKPLKLPLRYRLRPDRQKARYAYWDIAAALSLVVNAVLIGILVTMAGQLKTLKQAVSTGLLGGLYSSFVNMDNASIATTITVDAQIPLNFNLPVQQNTNVVLTQKTNIPGAYIGINILGAPVNGPANVTLPAGTNLPIALNMNIPVQATIPISLQVPVNIPLAATGLHGPFVGLQQAIQPYYCMLEPDAQYPQGTFICRQSGETTPANGAP